ncbi:uncharacterized protein LOC132698286 [Cylas formicarius]|uniref:uncharacterized protein LOC132698286 n=1 Tax=Cylas formicarius TaxID=197179 RepID=UPI0029584690|nr:uncharacterized protein LOC132698286 [Cylas formicarius]
MAPKTRSQSKPSNQNRRLVHFKSATHRPRCARAARHPNGLKNLFSSASPAKNEAASYDPRRIAQPSPSVNVPSYVTNVPISRSVSADDIQEKVYNVVSAAIEYGFANDILERNGDWFVFKNRALSRAASRPPTPIPRPRYCSLHQGTFHHHRTYEQPNHLPASMDRLVQHGRVNKNYGQNCNRWKHPPGNGRQRRDNRNVEKKFKIN